MKKTKMLKKNYEFKRVLNKGKYYSGNYIQAFIKPNNNRNLNFLGLAISVKIGKAIKRNKIKRLIRESYKNIETQLNTGYDIIFMWKKDKPFENAIYKNVDRDIKNILEKSKVLNIDNEKSMY